MTIGQAPQSFLFGSVSGSLVAFALFGGISVFIGVGTAAVLRRFAARPAELPFYGTTPIARRVIGSIVGGLLLGGVWWWLWSGFYELEVRREDVTLRFHLPSRQRVVPKREIAMTRWTTAPKATRVLVVETRSGKTYRSMQTLRNDAFERRVTQAVAANRAR